MLLLLLNYVVLRALWKIDLHLISTLVNKSVYYIIIIIIIIIIITANFVNRNTATNRHFPIALCKY